jgi:hypothetical protein
MANAAKTLHIPRASERGNRRRVHQEPPQRSERAVAPFDVEPYRSGDSGYAAGQLLQRRAVELLGVCFAAYVVVDGAFTTAPFLHAARKPGGGTSESQLARTRRVADECLRDSFF